MNKLNIVCHNLLKLIIGVVKWEHTRPICVDYNIPYNLALIRKSIYKSMGRLIKSSNGYDKAICDMSCYYTLRIWRHWRS